MFLRIGAAIMAAAALLSATAGAASAQSWNWNGPYYQDGQGSWVGQNYDYRNSRGQKCNGANGVCGHDRNQATSSGNSGGPSGTSGGSVSAPPGYAR